MRRRLPYPRPTSPSATAVMRGNRKTDTRPEVALRAALHARGLRFRKNYPVVTAVRIVRVDIAFTRRRLAIFVDGCYWHLCPAHGRIPKANRGYWEPKLRGNVQRDLVATGLLQDAGWKVVRIWEHETLKDAVEIIACGDETPLRAG